MARRGTGMDSGPAGHRRRLRERFLRDPAGLADYELVELLLTYAVPRVDTKPVARTMIERFGSLGATLSQSAASLTRLPGVGVGVGVLVAVVREMWTRALGEAVAGRRSISTPEDVADYVRMALGTRTREAVLVLCLNASNHLIHEEVLVVGTVNQAPVYPREVARAALQHNATAVILAHNHPGGQCRPSDDDLALTRQLGDSLGRLGVHLHDHLVVTAEGVYSIAAGRRLANGAGGGSAQRPGGPGESTAAATRA